MNYIIGNDSLTVYFKGNSYTVNKQSEIYPMVIDAINREDDVALASALDIRKTITESLQKLSDSVSISGSQIFYKEREITGLLSDRIFEVIRLGLDVKPMVRFLENLMQNPSKRAVDELFGFMEACKLPITSDGHFLAYKRVKADYKDVHSGMIDNSIGEVVEMQRNLVDEDKNNTCSYGLHFCSYDYLRHFGGDRIMVLKINPADVVAIPADYNNSKGRTCRYVVVDEIPVSEYNNLPTETIREGYEDIYDSDEFSDDLDFDEEIDDFVDDVNEVPKFNPSAKMTEKDVLYFRNQLKLGASVRDLAEEFGISMRQARRIANGEAWKNVG